MLRAPRSQVADPAVSEPVCVLAPLQVILWGPPALAHLGVPIIVGIHMLVVRDEDYQLAAQKLSASGFRLTTPNRGPPPDILESLPNPQRVLEKINRAYRRLDSSSQAFDYPEAQVPEDKRCEQLILIPNSFAHLPLNSDATESYLSYDVYGNALYPRERALVESFVKAAMDEQSEGNGATAEMKPWCDLLRAWIAMMIGYLDLRNDVLEDCSDKHVPTWYSKNFGGVYEIEHGPIDRRISKRVGSKKEMQYDMAGNHI